MNKIVLFLCLLLIAVTAAKENRALFPRKLVDNTAGKVLGSGSSTSIDQNCQCHDKNRSCVKCFSSYYLNTNSLCIVLPSHCAAADINGKCTSCIIGYNLDKGDCAKASCNLSLCEQFNSDQTECTSCSFRSYFLNGCCV
jgi:hypothetical protein